MSLTKKCTNNKCDMARAVMMSWIQTRLDFVNSILIGTSATSINKLQCVKNRLARVVLQNNYN